MADTSCGRASLARVVLVAQTVGLVKPFGFNGNRRQAHEVIAGEGKR